MQSDRRRWYALAVVCLGVVMVVLDTTVVNVALPSIRADLGFSETGLVWVLNAYMLFCGGFLLLGGRLGDLYGQRRVFMAGIALFTLASLACGFATSQAALVVGRALQGLGGAVVEAVSLALIATLFPDPAGRAKAMGVYGFVCAAGGSIGVLVGGVLVQSFDWHWIFLVNVPIGIAVCFVGMRLIAADTERRDGLRLDVAGAVLVTASLMLAVYAVVGGNAAGWTSLRTLGLLAVAAALFAAFVAVEARVGQPLVPLRLFGLANLRIANVVGVLWSAAMFAWFFLSALYMQQVLGWSALAIGLAFLPGNVVMAICSLGLSAKLVMRFGLKPPLVAGLAAAALGLALFARAPVDGTFWVDVLPGMLLLGLGAGVAFNPVLLAAMGDVGDDEAGLASGIVNTSFLLGGALGLAILASLGAARTDALAAAGVAAREALNGGYAFAFGAGAIVALLAALAGAALRERPRPAGSAGRWSTP